MFEWYRTIFYGMYWCTGLHEIHIVGFPLRGSLPKLSIFAEPPAFHLQVVQNSTAVEIAHCNAGDLSAGETNVRLCQVKPLKKITCYVSYWDLLILLYYIATLNCIYMVSFGFKPWDILWHISIWSSKNKSSRGSPSQIDCREEVAHLIRVVAHVTGGSQAQTSVGTRAPAFQGIVVLKWF